MIVYISVKNLIGKLKWSFPTTLFTFYFLLFTSPAFTSPAFAQTRAVWVRPFIGANEEIRRSERKSREFIRAELQKIKRANLDTVFVETFWDGYTIYPSKITQQRPLSIDYGTTDASSGKGFDVLRVYLEEAKKLNLEVHAWLHVFHQWNTNLGDISKSPVFSKHADWAALDQKGSPYIKSEAEGANREIFKVFLSPSNLAARRFLERIVREMTENYPDLSGVQWDYIRYPLHDGEQNFDFSENAQKQFLKESKLDARNLKTDEERKIWQEWKTRRVTETVESLSAIVRNKRPGWKISVAVFPGFKETLRVKMQDSRDWANRGLIDAIYPMLYAPDFKKVDGWASEFRGEIPAKTKVYATFFVSHFYDKQTGKIDERFLQIPAKYKYDGFGIFAAQLLTDDLIEKLRK